MNLASRLATRLAKWSAWLVTLVLVVLATVVLVYALQARARLPDLQAWHRIVLANEFSAAKPGMPDTFEGYLALESRLFQELHARLLDSADTADSWEVGRYNPNGVAGKLALDTPYNHSYEIAPQGEPRGSVLLLHGLSDSPYSMRAVAETFAAQGYYVVSLRMPGHGTLPSGLLDVSWKDWYAAVVLAAKHAAAKGGQGKPFMAAGHSTGAALIALYSVRALDDPSLPRFTDIHLLSAAIGISRFAVLTNIISGLSFLPAFEKSRWIDVLPEYDPYKYNSFPVNAANQIYKLTHVLQGALDLHTPEQLAGMPRVHVYHSIVDSTVTASEVIHGLLARLPRGGNELIVFDINRYETIESLITPLFRENIQRLRTTVFPFRLTLIANRDSSTRTVAAFVREADSTGLSTTELPLEWPAGVFSVGHVSLPFPVDDPVYGLSAPLTEPRFNLGAISAKGENGALVVGLGTFARLRSNPFFDVIRSNIIATTADH
jgi:alpha-beta hydrolase superfamily lysophospholipase